MEEVINGENLSIHKEALGRLAIFEFKLQSSNFKVTTLAHLCIARALSSFSPSAGTFSMQRVARNVNACFTTSSRPYQ